LGLDTYDSSRGSSLYLQTPGSWFAFPPHIIIIHYLHLYSELSILPTATVRRRAKCLICLSILIPEQPLAQYPFPFALTTLLNAALFSLVTPISLFVYNLLKLSPDELRANIRLAFIGYKLAPERLGDVKHIRLLHLYKEDGGELNRDFVFGGAEIEEDVVRRLRAHGVQEVWVTPELPFMIFITVGFFTSLLYGNLIFLFMSHL